MAGAFGGLKGAVQLTAAVVSPGVADTPVALVPGAGALQETWIWWLCASVWTLVGLPGGIGSAPAMPTPTPAAMPNADAAGTHSAIWNEQTPIPPSGAPPLRLPLRVERIDRSLTSPPFRNVTAQQTGNEHCVKPRGTA